MQRIKEKYLNLFGHFDDVSIGKCYHFGSHVPVDLALAKQYYLSAAKRAEPDAFKQLHVLANQEGKTAEGYFYKGMMHEFKQEWVMARLAFEEAVKVNHADALFRLGQLYADDRYSTVDRKKQLSIKKNKTLEIKYYRLAAKNHSKNALDWFVSHSQKDADAAYTFGNMYEKGEIGVVKNYHRAIEYYLLAAENKHQIALMAIENLQRYCSIPTLLRVVQIYQVTWQNFPKSFEFLIYLAQRGSIKTAEILNNFALYHAEYAHHIGDLYLRRNEILIASIYFFIAARKGNHFSLRALENLFEHLDKKQRFELAELHKKANDDISALIIYLQMGHDESANKHFSELVNRNPECAYQLALYYEKEQSLQKAYQYYLIAARKHHPASITYMHRLEVKAKNGNRSAQFYYGKYHYLQERTFAGVLYVMQASAQHYKKAYNFLRETLFAAEIVKQIAWNYLHNEAIPSDLDSAIYFYEKAVSLGDGEATCQLAELHISRTNNQYVLEAFDTLLKGTKLGYQPAIDKLHAMASSGNPMAQYYYGCIYLHHQQARYQAIEWAFRAIKQGCTVAQDYLDHTIFPPSIYLRIAESYQQGEIVEKNIEAAIKFYTKAMDHHSKEAAFQLAELYLAETSIEDNINKAFMSFLNAAYWGHPDAISSLECHAADINPALQMCLADLYQRPPLSNQVRALYWYQQASDGGVDAAEEYLHSVSNKY